MPAEMQKAVVGALTTESDPAKLQGFASAIQAQYPVAAGLLMAKAQALLLVHPVTPPAPQPTPVRPTPVGPGPAPVPIPTSGTYTVQSGDYPIKIAQKIVHDGSRWKELVAANPNKKRAADGNFATLLPGEVLKLPASWTEPPPMFDSKLRPALPPQGGSHASHS
jgi:nucleoid-associated protein YgaU